MNTRKWTMKNGEKIRIKDMETSHIKNCLRLLKRQTETRIGMMYDISIGIHGEEASFCIDRDIAIAEDEGFPELEEWAVEFQAELVRRGENNS